MRNGNERFLVAFQNTVSVLILPMRNGNLEQLIDEYC